MSKANSPRHHRPRSPGGGEMVFGPGRVHQGTKLHESTLVREGKAKDREIAALKGKLAEMTSERDRGIDATNAGLDDLVKQLAGRDAEIESLREQAAGLAILRGVVAQTLGVPAGTDLDDDVGAVAALLAKLELLKKELGNTELARDQQRRFATA